MCADRSTLVERSAYFLGVLVRDDSYINQAGRGERAGSGAMLGLFLGGVPDERRHSFEGREWFVNPSAESRCGMVEWSG